MQSFNVQLAVHYLLCILSLAAVFLRQYLNDTIGVPKMVPHYRQAFLWWK